MLYIYALEELDKFKRLKLETKSKTVTWDPLVVDTLTENDYKIVASVLEDFEKNLIPGPPNRIAYVNALINVTNVSPVVNDLVVENDLIVRQDDDLMYLHLKTPDGRKVRALIDSGASISGVAERLLKEHENFHGEQHTDSFSKFENIERINEKTIVYANSERGKSKRTYENVPFNLHDLEMTVPTLYEMPLPDGVDILLGIDWFRKENPSIDWNALTVKLRSKRKRVNPDGKSWAHAVKATAEVVKTSTNEGQISIKAMKKIIKRLPGLVTSMHVTPRNMNSEARIFATQTKTLNRQRMEAILQQKENDNAEGEAAPRSEDILYGKLRKSGINDLDTELHNWKDVIVEDLDKQKITQINQNKLRRETLEMSIETEDDGKIPHRPYRRLSFKEEAECTKVVEKYIDDGIIQPSSSPYGAAILFAPKKNGKLRFCVDWR